MTLAIDSLQSALLNGITTNSTSAFKEAQNHLRPNAYLSTAQALAIYRNAYKTRLLECLRADFPVLEKFLGDGLFSHFAADFIATHPPQSYSLFDLGARFPTYLQASCPELSEQTPAQQAQFLLLIELAKLERLQLEVTRAKEEQTTSYYEPDYHSEQELLQCSIEVPKICQFLRCTHHLLPYFEALKAPQSTVNDVARPIIEDTYIAVSRNKFRLNMHTISDWQHLFLQSTLERTQISASPICVGDMVSQLSESGQLDRNFLIANLPLWLPIAVSRSYISIS